jgi:hypothetical protein
MLYMDQETASDLKNSCVGSILDVRHIQREFIKSDSYETEVKVLVIWLTVSANCLSRLRG